MSYVLGLTGPTGAGKSIFSECAASLGFNVIDCDSYARQAVKKGSPALKALTGAFGAEILGRDGELDRKKLAEKAFLNPQSTELLNKTVLPYIAEIIRREIRGDFVLLDAPTLFESGIDKDCNSTAAVLSPVELRKQRIIERDGLEIFEANARIGAGKSDGFYRERADKIFINDGDIDSFKKTVTIYLKDILGGICNE